MQPAGFDLPVLHRLPLAEAVLHLWHWPCDAASRNALDAAHRGAGSTKALSFPALVALIGDARREHDGSGRPSFQRGRARGERTVTDQAAYQKLGRLPVAVSEAFLASATQGLQQLLPPATPAGGDLPDS